MTLPEVLIVTSVMGILVTVVAATITVSFRTVTGAEGRANVARAEQSIDTWLPADLTSTDVTDVLLPAVDTAPSAVPCTPAQGAPASCDGIPMTGANALQLAWKTTMPEIPPAAAYDVVTRVQYQYIEVGTEWQMQRIECTDGQACRMNVILHDLKTPPGAFDPDADKPVWVMDVAAPNDPAALGLSDNARRIIVTIDGGGDADGAGGGTNNVNLTAGGTTTSEIEADDFTVPSFVRAKSRCGGPVSLVVDDSGSIGSAVGTVVEPGVNAFIEAFRGTPTQIQVVKFESEAEAIGGGSSWHNYVDMTDDAAVDSLKASVISELDSSGGTNWEEAFFHTLKESDGTTAATVPNRIVFFTDGKPTRNRASRNGGWWDDYSNGDKHIHYNDGLYTHSSYDTEDGSTYDQQSFDRADVILDQHRGIDLIFVGVGPGLQDNIQWIHDPAVYQDRTMAAPPAQTKKAWETVAYLLANAPTGQVPAIYDSGTGEYTNPETADFYLQSSFDPAAFAAAMKAAALKDCGGTLTIQTKHQSTGANVADEFVYENVEYRDDTGTPVTAEARRVTTSAIFRTGTFDFEIPSSSTHFEVDVVPQELETLSGYNFVDWTCKSAGVPKTGSDIASIAIPASTWQGVSVTVKPNEAVSCVMTVSP